MRSLWADRWTRGLSNEWCDQASKVLAGFGEHTEFDIVLRDGTPSYGSFGKPRTPRSSWSGLLALVLVGMFQGSVSQHVAGHARSPVAVVRPPDDMAASRIVVGVDGSGTRIEALESRWALLG